MEIIKQDSIEDNFIKLQLADYKTLTSVVYDSESTRNKGLSKAEEIIDLLLQRQKETANSTSFIMATSKQKARIVGRLTDEEVARIVNATSSQVSEDYFSR